MIGQSALVERQRAEVSEGLFAAVHRLRWSAERLAQERQRRLRELLRWSAGNSPFWAQRLAQIDIETFTEAELPTLAVLRKHELMDNFDQILTRPHLNLERLSRHIDSDEAASYLDDEYRIIATSGSEGTRALFALNSEEWVTFVLLGARWRGRDGTPAVDVGSSIATLFSLNPTHVSGALHAFFEAPEEQSVAHLPATLPLPEIVEGVNRAQPVVLQGYPSMVYLLALEALAGRLSIAPRQVRTCGEQCTDRTRAAVREAWGVEVYDYWGATEGIYAFPCRVGKGMHLPDDLTIVESVDQHDRPVPAGVPGDKILLTNLYNLTEPLIRYEITDRMTVLQEPCECGCAHRLITDVRGRSESFFVYPGGVAVHGSGMTTALIAEPNVIEMQFTQTPRGMIASFVGRGPCDTAAIRGHLEQLMRRAGLQDPEVEVRQVDSIERLWSGKIRPFEPLPG